jgi:hypothetical protein
LKLPEAFYKGKRNTAWLKNLQDSVDRITKTEERSKRAFSRSSKNINKLTPKQLKEI